MKTILHLPFPPSVNGLFATNWRTKRRFPSEQYAAWQEHAGYALLETARGTYNNNHQRKHRHSSPVQVTYTFTPPDKRHRDVFNYEKAVSDFLVKHGILSDDNIIQKGIVQWMTGIAGVTVLIEDIE